MKTYKVELPCSRSTTCSVVLQAQTEKEAIRDGIGVFRQRGIQLPMHPENWIKVIKLN